MKKAYLLVPCGTGLQLRSHAQLGSVVSALGRPVRCGGQVICPFDFLVFQIKSRSPRFVMTAIVLV